MKYNITNIVANSTLPFIIDFEKINKDNPDVEYDPELFPGLKLTVDGKKVLIFKNSKMVLTGAKTIEELEDKIEKLSNKLNFCYTLVMKMSKN